LTNAYKIPHFISKNEKVRIPDVEYEQMSQDGKYTINITGIGFMPEEDSSKTSVSEESTVENEAESPDVGGADEINPVQKRFGREELGTSYEQSLKELAASVAQTAYYDAFNKRKAELKDCINGVQTLMDEMVNAHRRFIEEYTKELKYMAVDIAEKIILEKISEDDLILQRLILQSVNSVKNTEWLNVEISERLVRLVDCIKKELEKPEYNGRAFVFPVAGSDSICRVTTNDGTVVSTIEVQAENLRKTFREFEQQQ
jgi:flagellar biosynthesis/type III secretory pathway protein FliH